MGKIDVWCEGVGDGEKKRVGKKRQRDMCVRDGDLGES